MKTKSRKVLGIPLALFLVGILVLGGASAALLVLYATVTQTVTVEQGLIVDGHDWNDPIEPETVVATNELEEAIVLSRAHYISNAANVIGVVKLNSVCLAPGTDSCDEIVTTPVFEISITGNLTPGETYTGWDRVVTKSAVNTVRDITSLDFDYMLTETASGNSPYFVLELDMDHDGDKDNWAVSVQQSGMDEDEWYVHDGEHSQWHVVMSGDIYQSFSDMQALVGSAKVLAVKVAVGEWGDLNPTTALVKNIEVNTLSAIDNGIVVPADSISTVEGNVDFSIESYFPQWTIPNTYTITTSVLPVTTTN